MSGDGLRIGVTMREVQAQGYFEPRDALARGWGKFLDAAIPEAAWLPVPNLGAPAVEAFCAKWGLNGLILTGGEDLGVAPVRDESERAILRYCLQRRQPVLGVCRGLQLLWSEMGGQLEMKEGHRATRHALTRAGLPGDGVEQRVVEVNSYHRYCLRLPPSRMLEDPSTFARAADGTVEGVSFRDGRVVGVMWHPEREPKPDPLDIALTRKLFHAED
jgi:N5-(cytidine 5'-diphosphoramidyl)-L-glutamine hydrolase